MSKTAMDTETSSSGKGANFVITNNNGSGPATSSSSLVPSSLSVSRQAGARGGKKRKIWYFTFTKDGKCYSTSLQQLLSLLLLIFKIVLNLLNNGNCVHTVHDMILNPSGS